MWISPDIFKHDWKPDDRWEDADVRRAVDWFTSFLKADEWERRRYAAFSHFVGAASGEPVVLKEKGKFFDDKDRFAWYLLLGENFLERPIFYDTVFGSRVIPILESIGRSVNDLKAIPGVEKRVQRMVGKERAQPNACLFELLVAAAYLRAGGHVSFVEEKPGGAKTHEMDVLLGGVNYAVECKRMETSAYSEDERTAARALWVPVARHFEKLNLDVRCDVTYLDELRKVPTAYLAEKARRWLDRGALVSMRWSDQFGIGEISRLNLSPLQTVLKDHEVAVNSTRIHQLLLGEYKRNANIIQTLRVTRAANPLYIEECDRGTVCNWRSISSASIDSKARDVLKRVSEACAQLPVGRPSIIHIGLEAVEGDEVERARHAKVMNSLKAFDPQGKDLEYVYVHWFAPESPPDRLFAFDETRHSEAIRPRRPQPIDGFLVLTQEASAVSRKGGHWIPAR